MSLIQGATITGVITVSEKVNVQENKNVTPSDVQQVILPDDGFDAMAQVTVGAVPPDNLPAVMFGTETTPTIACPDASHKEFKGLTGVTSVTLSDATAIGANAFYKMNITSVSAPEVLTVGDGAFDTCESLTTVDLPKCTTLGSKIFSNATSLRSVDLPVCSNIGAGFGNCGVEDIYLGCDTVVTVNTEGDGLPATDCTIHVPSDMLASYQSSAMWATVIQLAHDLFGTTVTLAGDYGE